MSSCTVGISLRGAWPAPPSPQQPKQHVNTAGHSSVEITGSAVTRVKLKSAQRFQDRIDPLEKSLLTTGAVLTHTDVHLKGVLTGLETYSML